MRSAAEVSRHPRSQTPARTVPLPRPSRMRSCRSRYGAAATTPLANTAARKCARGLELRAVRPCQRATAKFPRHIEAIARPSALSLPRRPGPARTRRHDVRARRPVPRDFAVLRTRATVACLSRSPRAVPTTQERRLGGAVPKLSLQPQRRLPIAPDLSPGLRRSVTGGRRRRR